MTKTARLYGGSLYDLTVEEGCSEQTMEELTAIEAIFKENPDYLRVLAEPSIPRAERVGLLDAAFGGQIGVYLLNFLKVLCENGLLREFAGCAAAYAERYDEDHGIVQATVTSALSLDEGQLAALKARLEKMSGKTVRLRSQVDGSILGGLRVDLAGHQYDGTIEGRLETMRRLVQSNDERRV